MITAGVVIAEDPEAGMNAGVYRLMVNEKNITGIAIVSPNNLRKFAEKALLANKPLPISISIGTRPSELLAATFKANLGINELTFAEGLRGEPLSLTDGETIPVPCIADSGIVLEGEILPEGWVHAEGPFCEFNRLMGGIHLNPRVRIKALMHRKDPIYNALHMLWENIWIGAPIYEAAAGTRTPAGKGRAVPSLEAMAENITAALGKSHHFFAELVELFPQSEFRAIAESVGWLQQQGKIIQDGDDSTRSKSRYSSKPPGRMPLAHEPVSYCSFEFPRGNSPQLAA